jgi:hypothetical protein
MKKFWRTLGIVEGIIAWTVAGLILREFLRK